MRRSFGASRAVAISAARVGPVDPPPRLLMGPGVVAADPQVLRAVSALLVRRVDPAMTALMAETAAVYQEVFRTRKAARLMVDGRPRAGFEAALEAISDLVARPGSQAAAVIR